VLPDPNKDLPSVAPPPNIDGFPSFLGAFPPPKMPEPPDLSKRAVLS